MTFLLCDPGWYVHKPDVQNKWDDNTHTQHKKNDKTECGNYRGIALVIQAGKVALQVFARELRDNFEAKGRLNK